MEQLWGRKNRFGKIMNFKFLLVLVIGLVLACGGGYVRFHAQSWSLHPTGTSPMTDSSGNNVGSATFSQEDASETAALTDISLVLLYGGTSLVVVSVAAWLFCPRKTEHETRVAF